MTAMTMSSSRRVKPFLDDFGFLKDVLRRYARWSGHGLAFLILGSTVSKLENHGLHGESSEPEEHGEYREPRGHGKRRYASLLVTECVSNNIGPLPMYSDTHTPMYSDTPGPFVCTKFS